MSADTLTEFRVVRKKVIREETYIYAESWEDVESKLDEDRKSTRLNSSH